MRISDWSSDVCSSDLLPLRRHILVDQDGAHALGEIMATDDPDRHAVIVCQDALDRPAPALDNPPPRRPQAGGRGTTQCGPGLGDPIRVGRSEEHTSELQSLMRISYAVFCLKKKTQQHNK